MTSDHLCLALDVATAPEALDWVTRTRSVISTYKIGLQLFCAEGPQIVSAVRKAGAEQIFLDLKLHDIPNTVASTIHALGRLGVDLLTVHTAGGPQMLEAASEAGRAEGVRLLGVTVLTSLLEPDLVKTGVTGTPGAVVAARARLALAAGISGLVCSPNEVSALRQQLGAEPYLVTPGIRLAGSALGDQRRAATPHAAIQAGASLLVLGRTVREAPNVGETLRRIQQETAS
jgi:orotidine-5'-phosphate decarboxylase